MQVRRPRQKATGVKVGDELARRILLEAGVIEVVGRSVEFHICCGVRTIRFGGTGMEILHIFLRKERHCSRSEIAGVERIVGHSLIESVRVEHELMIESIARRALVARKAVACDKVLVEQERCVHAAVGVLSGQVIRCDSVFVERITTVKIHVPCRKGLLGRKRVLEVRLTSEVDEALRERWMWETSENEEWECP